MNMLTTNLSNENENIIETKIFELQDEIASLKRKLELQDEKYRYAIRKLKMVALELEND